MLISRRHFFFGSLALPALAATKPAGERPNILLIVVDNLPAWVLGAYGNQVIRTPNIDRLAQTGVRFLHHFACAPDPGPGFASLLTGRTPMQLGEAPAAAGDVTIEKVVGGLGYNTKTADGAGAAQFLDQQAAGKPFFLAARYNSLEPPYDGVAQKYHDLYAASRFDTLDTMRMAANAARGKEMLADLTGSLRKTAAAISAVDDEVGALLARLSAKRLADGTIVILTATCGALLGRHGLWDGARASDPPNLYEEVVNTPMIWRWLGRVPAQASRPELVYSCDLLPTICDITQAELPNRNLCGRSYLLPATGKPLPKKEPWRTTVFAQAGVVEMSHEDRYKLVVRNGGRGPNELFDLVTDPHEKINQYDNEGFVTVRTTLAGELAKWRAKYSA
jgi:arylsulfatase A-like enzyme